MDEEIQEARRSLRRVKRRRDQISAQLERKRSVREVLEADVGLAKKSFAQIDSKRLAPLTGTIDRLVAQQRRLQEVLEQVQAFQEQEGLQSEGDGAQSALASSRSPRAAMAKAQRETSTRSASDVASLAMDLKSRRE